MAHTKIAISLPPEIVTWLDEMVATRQQTRSGLIRELLEAYHVAEERERIRAEWKAIYDEIAEDERAMSEELLTVSIFPTLEPYDWSSEETHELSATG